LVKAIIKELFLYFILINVCVYSKNFDIHSFWTLRTSEKKGYICFELDRGGLNLMASCYIEEAFASMYIVC